MTTSVSTAKKSSEVSQSCSEDSLVKRTISAEQGYYEEAWDVRMARLGLDIAQLFTESAASADNDNCDTLMQSCIEHVERDDPPLIRMTSSAIEKSVIANNPVYSFKAFEGTPKGVSSSPVKNNFLHNQDIHETLRQHGPDSDQTLEEYRPSSGGFLLNNNCYEVARSQLVNAIIDNDSDPHNIRLSSRIATSAFKPLTTSKFRPNQPSTICNNHCYASIPVSTVNNSINTNSSYSRQVSVPCDYTTEMVQKRTYPASAEDFERISSTLQFKSSRRSMKSVKQVNLVQPTSSWTLKGKLQIDQHLSENNRMSSKLMSKSMTADESRSSDNYIKHLTGQEIAGNFIKQSQRPECHLQRTEDRYHMGFNDSRLDMIADSNRPLEEHLWYHPFLSRVSSEQLLAKYPEGSFLVRRSETSSNEYSLSIRYKQKWLHMKISRDIDGQFVLGQYSQPYPSIPIMIRHYSCSFLPVKGANLISLQQPVFRL